MSDHDVTRLPLFRNGKNSVNNSSTRIVIRIIHIQHLKNSSKFVDNIFVYLADRQTNTQRQKHNLLGGGNEVDHR